LSFPRRLGRSRKTRLTLFFESKYANLETVLDTIEDDLKEHGIFIKHSIVRDGELQILQTEFMHMDSGDTDVDEYILNPVKKDPQAVGSAISYGRRYNITTKLGLVMSDDDGNAGSGRQTPAQKLAEDRTKIHDKIMEQNTQKELVEFLAHPMVVEVYKNITYLAILTNLLRISRIYRRISLVTQ